jgi:hypothetical protein
LQNNKFTIKAFVFALAFASVACQAQKVQGHESVSADPARLSMHVNKLAMDLYPRVANFGGHLNEAAAYMKAQFLLNTPRVSEQAYEVKGVTYRNVIAKFGPETGSITVIGAHYDSCWITPGADDNASGSAALLELSRIFKERPPKEAVELVAYTLEEPPFFGTSYMGSFVHAQSLKEKGADVRVMISVEMIGYFSEDTASQKYPMKVLEYVYPDKGNFIAVVGRFTDTFQTQRIKYAMSKASPIKVETLSAPSDLMEIGLSDHRNYWEQGYKAVMITDTAFLRNQNYHQRSDTPETLNFKKMAEVVDGIAGVVLDD